jgi:hypothetical protein
VCVSSRFCDALEVSEWERDASWGCREEREVCKSLRLGVGFVAIFVVCRLTD